MQGRTEDGERKRLPRLVVQFQVRFINAASFYDAAFSFHIQSPAQLARRRTRCAPARLSRLALEFRFAASQAKFSLSCLRLKAGRMLLQNKAILELHRNTTPFFQEN
jgi:hypothetical protein